MPEQLESKDMLVWRNHRQVALQPLYKFCRTHSIPITNKRSIENIPSSANKIVYLNIGDLIENFEGWQKFNEICVEHQKIVYVVTDNFYNFQNLSNIYFFAFTELNGVFFTDEPLVLEPNLKLYNCFINRSDPVRQSWFYFLQHHNLLNQGYVSFLLKNNLSTYNNYQGKELFDYVHDTYNLAHIPSFEMAYQELKNSVPYQNFLEISDLALYTAQSKYSLVLETYATDNRTHHWHFSEKSMRALQQPTIPLLFLQGQGLAHLKSLGFELFSDYTYIDDMSWQDRQFELLKILVDDSIEYKEKELVEICQHNRQVLKNMLLCASSTDYFDNLFTCILEN